MSRRKLAESFFDILGDTPNGQYRARLLYSTQAPVVGFLLLIVPRSPTDDYVEYRKARFFMLESYCQVAKLMQIDKLTHIAGIATDGRATSRGNSFDLLYYEATQWDPGEQEHALHIQQVTGILTNARTWREEVTEYPE